jgi:hypothetical protein
VSAALLSPAFFRGSCSSAFSGAFSPVPDGSSVSGCSSSSLLGVNSIEKIPLEDAPLGGGLSNSAVESSLSADEGGRNILISVY